MNSAFAWIDLKCEARSCALLLLYSLLELTIGTLHCFRVISHRLIARVSPRRWNGIFFPCCLHTSWTIISFIYLRIPLLSIIGMTFSRFIISRGQASFMGTVLPWPTARKDEASRQNHGSLKHLAIHQNRFFLSNDTRFSPGLRIPPVAAGEGAPEGASRRQRRQSGSSHLLYPMPRRIMIHNNISKDDGKNYRAICLLSHAFEIFFMCLLHRVLPFTEQILPDTQAGFRQTRGCRDTTCLLAWKVDWPLEKERTATITYIDIKAAFESISHDFLL